MATKVIECDNYPNRPAAKPRQHVAAGASPRTAVPTNLPAAKRRQQVSIRMGAYTKLTYHVVFATKYRRPLITDDFRERLYKYVGGIIRGLDGHLIQIGGIEDHIHLLANLSPAMAVSDAVREIKANGSKWVNELAILQERFEWQKG
jgi:REP element-mobilizing transposase RayT